MANGDSTMNVTGGAAAGAGEEPQGAEQQSLRYLLDGLEDQEGSNLGGAEASRLISASAKSQKLVERAVAAIAVLENHSQFWNWRTVCENEISKFCMSGEDSIATAHLTLSTNIRTNCHFSSPEEIVAIGEAAPVL